MWFIINLSNWFLKTSIKIHNYFIYFNATWSKFFLNSSWINFTAILYLEFSHKDLIIKDREIITFRKSQRNIHANWRKAFSMRVKTNALIALGNGRERILMSRSRFVYLFMQCDSLLSACSCVTMAT